MDEPKKTAPTDPASAAPDHAENAVALYRAHTLGKPNPSGPLDEARLRYYPSVRGLDPAAAIDPVSLEVRTIQHDTLRSMLAQLLNKAGVTFSAEGRKIFEKTVPHVPNKDDHTVKLEALNMLCLVLPSGFYEPIAGHSLEQACKRPDGTSEKMPFLEKRGRNALHKMLEFNADMSKVIRYFEQPTDDTHKKLAPNPVALKAASAFDDVRNATMRKQLRNLTEDLRIWQVKLQSFMAAYSPNFTPLQQGLIEDTERLVGVALLVTNIMRAECGMPQEALADESNAHNDHILRARIANHEGRLAVAQENERLRIAHEQLYIEHTARVRAAASLPYGGGDERQGSPEQAKLVPLLTVDAGSVTPKKETKFERTQPLQRTDENTR